MIYGPSGAITTTDPGPFIGMVFVWQMPKLQTQADARGSKWRLGPCVGQREASTLSSKVKAGAGRLACS